MGYVTAGLLSGIGAGLQTVGKTIEDRRQQALEWARKELIAQQDREARAAENAAQREHSALTTMYRETQANRRHKETLTTRETLHEDGQVHEAEMEKEKQRGRERLENLRAQNQLKTDAASIRLREKLDDPDIYGVSYGKPDESGMAELFFITNDRRVISSGEYMMIPESRDGKTGRSSGPRVKTAWD